MRKLIFLICPLFLIYVLFFPTLASGFDYGLNNRPIRQVLLESKQHDQEVTSNFNEEYALKRLEQISRVDGDGFVKKSFREILSEYKSKEIVVNDEILARFLHSNVELGLDYVFLKERLFLESAFKQKFQSDVNNEYALKRLEQISHVDRDSFAKKSFREILNEYKSKEIFVNDEILARFLHPRVELGLDHVFLKERLFFESAFKQRKEAGFNKGYALNKIEKMGFNVIEVENSFNEIIKVVIEDFVPVPSPTISQEEIVVDEDKQEGEITFTLGILPVRFVYFNTNGDVVKIWNNVKKGDDVYVLKFFDIENDSELELTQSYLSAYSKILQNLDLFSEGYIYEINYGLNEEVVWDVSLEYLGENYIEIYTYI